MNSDLEQARLWRKLTDNQRLLLMNETVPRSERADQSHTIVAIRALVRVGLIEQGRYGWALTDAAGSLAEWARERGYAQREGDHWAFTTPTARRIDEHRLRALAAAGHCAADIARQLNVSRQAVSLAAKRYGVTIARKSTRIVRPNLELPEPDGRDSYGPGAWWLLSSGAHLFAQAGSVYGLMNNDPRCLDGIEQDALASLAAVRWAREASQTHAGDRPA